MRVTAADYFAAAHERLGHAELLWALPAEQCAGWGERRYATVVYLAGLAAECMLRAHKRLTTDLFDGRHYLVNLLHTSGLERLERALARHGDGQPAIDNRVTALVDAVQAAADLWANECRFAPDRLLVREYVARGVIGPGKNRGQKAQVLRPVAGTMPKHARLIVREGATAWP